MRRIFLTLGFLILLFFGFGQANRNAIIGAYVYNFALHTYWPSEALSDSFRILLVSSQPRLIEEFKTFASNRIIHNKPISLTVNHQGIIDIEKGPNLVFISQEEASVFKVIYEKFKGEPVMVVTENLANQSTAMINLYDSPTGELLFEVNKANIVNHNLSINPELLLSGGSEIDVVELYRGLQKSLEQEQQKIEQLNDSLHNLNSFIVSSLEELRKQQENIQRQEQLLAGQEKQIALQSGEIHAGKEEMTIQRLAISKQAIDLNTQKELLDQQSNSIQQQITELLGQREIIDGQNARIGQSKQTLDSLMKEIVSKNIVLTEQSDIIYRQRLIMILSIVAGSLLLIILVLMYMAFAIKKKRNLLLQKQKKEIDKINQRIRTTNQSLFNTIVQLKETQSQLVSSEKMASLGVLTAGIAHEINNPVNFIYTGINSLKKDFDDVLLVFDKVKQLQPGIDNSALIKEIDDLKQKLELVETTGIIAQTIEDIKTGAERSADIIRGLRNFSRIDADTMTQADVHEGIDSALLLLRNKFKQFISVDKAYAKLPKIECYPGKLNQAFLNVISNAIDAIEGAGTITITTSLEMEMVRIDISDTGKGIPANFLDKIFDPFFTTKSVGKGVGLGLSITFGIIKEHNGKIEVKSIENHGTVFTIFLPCVLTK